MFVKKYENSPESKAEKYNFRQRTKKRNSPIGRAETLEIKGRKCGGLKDKNRFF